MIFTLCLAFVVAINAGGIKWTDFPKNQLFACGSGASHQFKWEYDTKLWEDSSVSKKIDVFLQHETVGANELVAKLGVVEYPATSFTVDFTDPLPVEWTDMTMTEHPLKIDGRKNNLIVQLVAQADPKVNSDCTGLFGACFDPDFDVTCKACPAGEKDCDCMMSGTTGTCAENLMCQAGKCVDSKGSDGRGIKLLSHPTGDVQCGSTFTLSWEYEDEGKKFMDAATNKKMNIALKRESIGGNELIALLKSVDYPMTRTTISFPSPFPLEWVADTNEHKLTNNGKSYKVTVEVESDEDPSKVTSFNTNFFRSDPNFSLSCCPKGMEDCLCDNLKCNPGLVCDGTDAEKSECELDETCTEGADNCRCIDGVGGTCTDSLAVCEPTGICKAGMLLGRECVPSTHAAKGVCASRDVTPALGCFGGKCGECPQNGMPDCPCLPDDKCNEEEQFECHTGRCVLKKKTGCLGCECGANNACDAANLKCDNGKCIDAATVACSAANPNGACPSGQACQNGSCVALTTGNECSAANPSGACPSGGVCQQGSCVAAPPPQPTGCNPACGGGQQCIGGSCTTVSQPNDPCAGGCKAAQGCGDGFKLVETKKDSCNCDVNVCAKDNAGVALLASLSLLVAAALVVVV